MKLKKRRWIGRNVIVLNMFSPDALSKNKYLMCIAFETSGDLATNGAKSMILANLTFVTTLTSIDFRSNGLFFIEVYGGKSSGNCLDLAMQIFKCLNFLMEKSAYIILPFSKRFGQQFLVLGKSLQFLYSDFIGLDYLLSRLLINILQYIDRIKYDTWL